MEEIKKLFFKSIEIFENQFNIKLNLEYNPNIEQELAKREYAYISGGIDISNDVLCKLGILYPDDLNVCFHIELDNNNRSISIYCELAVYDMFLNRDNVYVSTYNIRKNKWSIFEFDPDSF